MDDTFRQQQAEPFTPDPNQIQMQGKMPPGMKEALKRAQGERPVKKPAAPEQKNDQPPISQARPLGTAKLESLLESLEDHIYEEIVLPSKGIFYNGSDGPVDGKIDIRAMTGEEEQILATQRFVRKGQAVNMIFQRCIRQKEFRPDNLLSVDRTYLLIWLRGISYGHEYEVEVKCADCERRFSTVINLDKMLVDYCPSDFQPPLEGTLPKSKFHFRYHLSRGKDETAVQSYRDNHMRHFGGDATDDTLMYRYSLLVDEIQGLTDKMELLTLLKKMPIQDIAHIRNLVSEPPFGVDTKVEITCVGCLSEFEVDMPLEANFFFPRKRLTEKTPD